MKAKVIVPLDGSVQSERSLSSLWLFKDMPDVRIELLIVKEPAGDRPTVEEMQAYVDERARELGVRHGLDVRGVVESGIPYVTILAEATAEDVAMVVMTTHGRSANDDCRVGSVAEKLIRLSRSPTLVLGCNCPRPLDLIDLVIVPLDGSPLAESALPVAALIAERLGKPVTLVRVLDPQADNKSPNAEGDLEQRLAEASAYLANAGTFLPAGVKSGSVVRQGPLTETLIDELKQHPTGLVVMSAHGGHSYKTAVLGQATESVLVGPLPVLVVEPGHLQRAQLIFGV